VLDVACRSGNAALAAARRFCRVVGVDGDPALLARARRRAEAEGLEATFLEGEADDLPFPDRAGALKTELLEVARRFDVAEDDTLVLRVDYLEVVARTTSWR
jgi:SAM-dependent methyltransferase